MCSAPKQGLTLPASVDLEKETVITGRVVDGAGQAVGGAFVRLLDASDEFTAEVVASATGDFRFFPAPDGATLASPLPAGDSARSVQVPGAAKKRKSPVADATTSAVNSSVESSSRTNAPPTA